MRRLFIIAGGALFLSVCQFAEADTLFTTPVLYVQPMALDFGPVAAQAVATNTFVVENMGRGTLVGNVTVAAPFKILSGGEYALRENEVQIIKVVYTPSGAASDTQVVKFTGGGGTKASATGKLDASGPKQSKRK